MNNFYLILILSCIAVVHQKSTCEVCIKNVQFFYQKAGDNYRNINKNNLEDWCGELTKQADINFCSYIGAHESSVTHGHKDVARLLAFKMEPEKLCKRISEQNKLICELNYPVTLDFATINFHKTKIGVLKTILSDWNEKCKYCTEKTEFISLIEKKMKIHEPKAYNIRQQKKSEL
ncbi:hypothetical protein A3Q56_04320 [Intoshia linei]|uniref:Mesencephalic astrocyte-derived neurotrophic factor homolog n=1 Tax=Intoshia linei TaxID=1819745 RepID=A0A177B0Z8_9BILA|nr:hypothetical protein A3Q56_04320 [Intoshia linei]